MQLIQVCFYVRVDQRAHDKGVSALNNTYMCVYVNMPTNKQGLQQSITFNNYSAPFENARACVLAHTRTAPLEQRSVRFEASPSRSGLDDAYWPHKPTHASAATLSANGLGVAADVVRAHADDVQSAHRAHVPATGSNVAGSDHDDPAAWPVRAGE